MSLTDALFLEEYRDPREIWIALRPDGSQAYFARAKSRRAVGDTAGADQDHKRALLLDGR